MNTTATQAPEFAGKTAEQWNDMATGAHREAADSFERCDTDGFLSQWASTQMAQRYWHLARIAALGGYLVQEVPADLATGEIIRGQWRDAAHGRGWCPADRAKPWLFPSYARKGATRRAKNEAKGYVMVCALVPQELNRRTMQTDPDVTAEWIVLDASDERWVDPYQDEKN